jgi:hypothetical protein
VISIQDFIPKISCSWIGEVRGVKRSIHPKSYLHDFSHADCWELGLQLSFFLEPVLIVDSPYLNKTQVFEKTKISVEVQGKHIVV